MSCLERHKFHKMNCSVENINFNSDWGRRHLIFSGSWNVTGGWARWVGTNGNIENPHLERHKFHKMNCSVVNINFNSNWGRRHLSFSGSWNVTGGSHPVWPRDSFGPTLTSARKYFGPEILRPGHTSARNNFGPENTSARLYTLAHKQLRPREYVGPLIYFGPEILRPDRLRPATLWPGDRTFKSVMFHHFWPSISLGGAPRRN